MRKRHPNPRHVKIHYSYTVEEIARALGFHKRTVRSWIKSGLPVVNDQRPHVRLRSGPGGVFEGKTAEKQAAVQAGAILLLPLSDAQISRREYG